MEKHCNTNSYFIDIIQQLILNKNFLLGTGDATIYKIHDTSDKGTYIILSLFTYFHVYTK